MEKNIFIDAMTVLVKKEAIEDSVALMKRLWIKISINDARVLIKSAIKYNTTEGEEPFPKEIGGVMYKSAGEYVYNQLNDEQKATIDNSTFSKIKVE